MSSEVEQEKTEKTERENPNLRFLRLLLFKYGVVNRV
jgi:hypothetical protein